MKTKICFIVSSPMTAKSFLQGHIAILSTEYEVHLIANYTSIDEIGQFPSVKYHNVPVERKIKLLHDFKTVWQLKKIFNQEQFFAIHSVTPKAGLLTSLAGFMAFIPNRIHIFTGQVWATKHGVKRWLLMGLDKLIAVLNTKILVDGKSQRDYLIEHHILNKQKSDVVGDGSICGVDSKRFKPDSEIRQKVRNELKIDKNRIVFIFLGRLNHDKGLDELFAAFDRLANDNSNAYLLLVGMDEEGYDKKISNYSAIKRGENYHFYGLTSKPEDLLQAADIFCLPTYREGFGSSVIEASCIGLPVICSDAYGVMDAMIDNVTGLRCKVGDANSLYCCMKVLYEDTQLRTTLGTNGRRRVLDKFSSEIITKAWLQFYRSL